MFNKKILICTLLLFVSILSIQAKSLSMGWEDWPPYLIKGESNVSGLDYELINAILQEMNMDLELQEVPWARHLAQLEAGKIDLASGASKNAEREAYAYFSEPYRTESAVLFIRNEDGDKIKLNSLKDIINTDLKIGVTADYYYGEDFEQLKKNPEFVKHLDYVSSDGINIKKLLGKRIDGYLADKISGVANLKKANALNNVKIHSVPVYSDDIFVMFSKKSTSPELVKEFNNAFKKIKEKGIYEKIMNNYLK